MSKLLTDEQVAAYHRDGVVFPMRVISEEQAASLLGASNDLEQRIGENAKATDLAQMHLHFRWAYDLVVNPQILNAVEDVLGPNIVGWATGLFPKQPNDPKFISWHQDGTYWNLDTHDVVTAWIALSPATIDNGCMRVIPGTHKLPIQPHTDTYAADNLLSRGQEIGMEIDDNDAIDIVLDPGEMSLHHVKIVHGSNGNESDTKRVGFTVRYVPTACAQTGHRPQAILARGEDTFGNFDFIGPPPELPVDEAVAAMKASAQQQLESVMKK
jgi:ectoine hydroxylase-related dioxygenase (phytanoyl-CoA dioxygenase family)